MKNQPKTSIWKKLIVGFIFGMAFLSYYPYQILFTPNVHLNSDYIYVPIYSEETFDDVAHKLRDNYIISDYISFRFISKLMKYNENVKAGMYKIENKMTNIQLVRMLRNKGVTVKVTYNTLRTKKDIAYQLCKNLEADEKQFLGLLNNDSFVSSYGFDTFSVVSIFIPNTYELYWNTSEKELFEKMYKQYQLFWNEERTNKAKQIGLSPNEVVSLASIVEAEQQRNFAERPKIAGVYINRLEKGIPLQADPTLVFAHQDFTINRVRKGHKEINSPYNTYMYAGLPPGPINTPSINSIDAVLNYEKHNYYYFCASGQNGLHNFANTFEQHLQNARQYQKLLNKANID